MNERQEFDSEALQRINHLEAQNASIRTRLDGFERSLEMLQSGLDRVLDLISHKKTDFGAIGTWAGVIIGLNGAITAGIHTLTDQKIKTLAATTAENSFDVRRVEERLYSNGWSKQDQIRYQDRVLDEFNELRNKVFVHQKDGHPDALEQRIELLEKRSK